MTCNSTRGNLFPNIHSPIQINSPSFSKQYFKTLKMRTNKEAKYTRCEIKMVLSAIDYRRKRWNLFAITHCSVPFNISCHTVPSITVNITKKQGNRWKRGMLPKSILSIKGRSCNQTLLVYQDMTKKNTFYEKN